MPLAHAHSAPVTRGLRAGTENTPGIAGFGVAAQCSIRDLASVQAHRPWRDAAESMVTACAYAGTARIVYLSGLVPDVTTAELSDHLRSRLEVEELLLAGPTPALLVYF